MNKRVLLSYPRSGNHLVRFFIELLSEKPTSGCLASKTDIELYKNKYDEHVPFNIVNKTDFIFYKEHTITDLNKFIGTPSFLLFIVRNPREVLLRHSNNQIKKEMFDVYFDLIDYYENFQGPKHVLYYEDLINNKKEFLLELTELLEQFTEIKEEKKNYVLSNIDKLYKLCGNGKGRAWGGMKSTNTTDFYYSKFQNKQIFEEYLKSKTKKTILEKYFK